jgi:lipid-binding SYLF domain-containing protein
MSKWNVARGVACAVLAGAIAVLPACSTTPKDEDRATVKAESGSTIAWFKNNVSGLDRQIQNSGGYVVLPNVGQVGLGIGGSKFGRGVVYDGNDQQVGWAYINSASIGLQLGVQGFKMLVVFEDAGVLSRFKQNKLTGNVGAVAVAGEAGGSSAANFTDGVAIYQGANTGLMAGVSIGLEYMRYEPLE